VLSSAEILKALTVLGQELEQHGQKATILIFGGAAMALQYSARAATKDIDALFRKADDVVLLQETIKAIAKRYRLPQDWLNDEGKQFITEEILADASEEFRFGGLSVLLPSTEALLATKVCSLRIGEEFSDLSDTLLLMRKCRITNSADIATIVSHYRPDDAGRVLSENAALIDDLVREATDD
jgi:hypothetical protein